MGKGPEMDTEHEFILVLDGISDLDRDVVDAFFEAGCDDATIVMRAGRVSMGFTRSAPSIGAAIFSAIADIRKAGIGARVVRVEEASPDTSRTETARGVGAINSALQLSAAIEIDPTLRPLVVDFLAQAP
jgi:hypothetical protein